jgi:hypothetical protein
MAAGIVMHEGLVECLPVFGRRNRFEMHPAAVQGTMVRGSPRRQRIYDASNGAI